MRLRPGFSLLLTVSLCACSGTQSPETVAPEPQGTAEASPPPEAPSANSDLSAAEEEALAAIEAEFDEPLDDGSGAVPKRDIVYRLTQQGLHVELEGADFAPVAKSKKVPGGYGLELSVQATSNAELMLLSPLDGPMAFGGKVIRASGEVETFGDRRSDGGSLPLAPDIPQTFKRSWPIPGVDALAPGDELLLQVGLWGLGQDESSRRPVRKFLVVKMKASANGATPIVEPPAQ